ncbi:MAG: hypothetical protein R2697_14925 [Ilumatobacteraceae bacterium]
MPVRHEPARSRCLSPVVATTLGVIVLDESFTGPQSAGIAVTLVALIAGQFQPRAGQRTS